MVEVRGNPLIFGGLGMLTNGILSYHCFTGEIDITMIYAVLFFASIVVFAYLAYKLHQKRKWRERWVWTAWVMLGASNSVYGFVSGNMVIMIIGVAMALASMSAFLTSYVESELRVKKALEVVFGVVAFGVVIYGYVITRSLILGIMLLFAATLLFVGFVLSYLLPKIRSKSKKHI